MMQSLGCLGMALLQEDMGSMSHDVHLMMIGMWIIVAALALAFVAIAVAGLMMLKVVRKVEEIAERADSKVWPLVDKTQAMVEELSPKVRTIVANVEQISYTVRGKVDEFSVTASEINRTVKDVNARTQAKVSRVDSMVTEALNTVHHVSRTVQDSVRKPVQQVAGIIAAMKNGLQTLAERSPFMRHAKKASDADTAGTYQASARYESATTTKRTTPYDL
jgi:methyl-accepting chemotaxis protein